MEAAAQPQSCWRWFEGVEVRASKSRGAGRSCHRGKGGLASAGRARMATQAPATSAANDKQGAGLAVKTEGAKAAAAGPRLWEPAHVLDLVQLERHQDERAVMYKIRSPSSFVSRVFSAKPCRCRAQTPARQVGTNRHPLVLFTARLSSVNSIDNSSDFSVRYASQAPMSLNPSCSLTAATGTIGRNAFVIMFRAAFRSRSTQ